MAIEGGPFTCNPTGFKTEDVDEWNQHCKEHNHLMSGETICRECGILMTFKQHPYIPIEKDSGHLKDEVRLRCKNCEGETWNPRGVTTQRIEKEMIEEIERAKAKVRQLMDEGKGEEVEEEIRKLKS